MTRQNNITTSNKRVAVHVSRHAFLLELLAVAAVLAIGTFIIRYFGLDLLSSRYFFLDSGLWAGKHIPLFRFFYDYGTLPAVLIASGSLLVFIGSYFVSRFRSWRICSLFLTLVMLLGPGLLVNAIFKEHWGRPRPRNVVEFSGKYAFEEVWEYDSTSGGNSFPSGHASMGFYFFAFFFIIRRNRKRLAILLLLFALLYGSFMGMVRIAQGGHFASDVLWSGGMVYIICIIMAKLLRLNYFSQRELH